MKRFAAYGIAVVLACLAGCSADPDASGPRTPSAGTYATSGAGGTSGTSGASGTGGGGGNGFGNPNEMTAGNAGAAGTLGTSGAGGTSDTCAQGMATATPVTPIVWLVLDGSSSMNERFGATGTRWQTLRTTLMDPGGIVDSLQSIVRFGMVIYSGADAFGTGTECVKLVTVDPALDNYATLLAQYPADPIGMGTPTHKAIEHVVNNLPVLNQQMLDMDLDPTFVVLATDGAPNDNCGGGGGLGNGAEQQVLDIVTQGTTQGMNMFVISLAGGDMQLQSHLDQVAAATKTMTPPLVPDTRTVQLNGTACETFLSTASMVVAEFPCTLFTPD